MAKVTAAQRNAMGSSSFAVPEKRKLLITDKKHATLAWDMVNRTGGLTSSEKSSARGHIKAKLHEFGVDTSKYNEKLSWGDGGLDITQLGTTSLMVLGNFIEDLSDADALDLSEALSEAKQIKLQKKLNRLVHKTEKLTELGYQFSDGANLVTSTEGGDPMVRIPIASKGLFVHPVYGIVDFDQQDFDDIKSNFESGEAGFEPYLRYGHAKFPEAVDAEPAIGHLKKVEQDDNILWGIYKPLSPEVVEQVRSGAYRWSSSEIRRYAISKFDGRPIGTLLTACALTNAPFVPDLPENQVYSEALLSAQPKTPVITLFLSNPEGEEEMSTKSFKEELSEIAALAESLSDSQNDVDALRARLASLAGTTAQPGYDSNKPAGIEGDKPEASKLTDGVAGGNAVDKPAGIEGDKPDASELSHGDPLKVAGKQLEKMGKNEDKEDEKMSSALGAFGEFLSNLSGAFKGPRNGNMTKLKPDMSPMASSKSGQKFSDTPVAAAITTVPTASDEGGAKAMTKEEIEQFFSEKTAGVVTELNAANTKITALETQLAATAQTAEQFSNSMVEAAFNTRVNGLVMAGIPASTVHAVAALARSVRGQVQKLSDGSEVDMAESMFRSLETLPGSSRVSYEQVGQQLSNEAAMTGADPYAEIIGNMPTGTK